MDLLFKTKKNIEKHALIEPGDHLLIAVSGGIDSMALLNILLKLEDTFGYTVSVIHVNHGLRGADSDNDEHFVQKFCREKEIPFYSEKWSGPDKGENLQEAARDFRYEVFLKTAESINANKIALAHNLDDQAETVLLNLFRGAGLDGLCGMSISKELKKPFYLIRPLLDAPRSEIEAWVESEGVSYRNDITNDQTKYSRNFIRHEIVPLIKKINPGAIEAVSGMTLLLRKDEEFIQKTVAKMYIKVVVNEASSKVVFDRNIFLDMASAVRTRLLKHAYAKLTGSIAGINRDQILKIDNMATGPKKEGLYSLSKSVHFELKNDKLIFFKR